ncbi:phytoene desaturase [Pedobacter sp.]|nr:phytoene desaturase [Candidatus Saccharibacteria bacterium]
MKKVVIIGAGIGGIATASYLAKSGYDVHVYEKLDYAGGRAGVLDVDGFHFDTGPSWYLMPEVFEHYFKLMGVTADEVLNLIRLDPAYKVYFGTGEPIVITADQQQNRDTFEQIEPGAGEKLRRYVRQAGKAYDLSMKHFLYTNFQTLSEFIKLDIFKQGPNMLRLSLTSYDREVSRFFTDSRLKRVLEYSSVFLGSSPFETPGIYTLMAALDYRDGVFYPRGGIYAVVEAMAHLSKVAGVTYHLNEPVAQIIVEDKLATGIKLESSEVVSADIVISNADLHFTETKLLETQWQTYPESYWKPRNPGPSALMMYLGVKGTLPELEHHDLLFVDEWRENFDAIYKTKQIPRPASIYISRATATDPDFAPKGHEALVVLVPFPAGYDISKAERETLADEYLRDIERMTGINDLSERIVSRTIMTPGDFSTQYNSWQGGALGPAHILKQTAILRTGNYSKKVRNLYYVGGATIPGIGVPMVIIGAELVYKRIIGDIRGGMIKQLTSVATIYKVTKKKK